MKLRPMNGRVVVQPEEAREVTAGGIYLPETAQEKVHEGTVVAVAEDATEDVAVGDRVIFREFGGTKVTQDDVEYILLGTDDLVAKYEDLDQIPE